MFSVIYKFKVHSTKTNVFITGWRGLTELIYQYAGSLGSNLSLDKSGDYIAYANWPSKMIWENAGVKLPKKADEFRVLMWSSCEKIEILFELEGIENLWQDEEFQSNQQ